MIRVLIKPAKRLFTKRRQWTWEIHGANGELLDPRETYNNRVNAIATMMQIFGAAAYGPQPVELVIYDQWGNVERRKQLRG